MIPLALVGAAALGAISDAVSGASDASTVVSKKSKDKAKQSSEEFEAVFLNSMFSQMYSNVNGEGPFGGSGATGIYRSLLTDEYSKAIAKKGGIGIAEDVYRSLLTQQEAATKKPR